MAKTLKDSNLNLYDIAEKLYEKGYTVDELIEADKNGDVAVFDNKMDFIWWQNDCEYVIKNTLESLFSVKGSEIGDRTILDYLLDSKYIIELEDGQIIYIYN